MDFWFIPCNLYSILHDYLFANKLILKSILCSIVFSTRLNSFFFFFFFFFFSLTRLIACRSISWIPFVYLLEHPSSPASGMLPTGLQYNGYFVNTLFISSTHHCLSLLIAFNTLFLSRLLCFLLRGCNTSVMRIYKHRRLVVWVLSVPRT